MKKYIIVIAIVFALITVTSCTYENNVPSPTMSHTPSATPQPTPTITPTPMPTSTPTPHPDLKKHYTTRESIDGYENMSEEHIQELLDMYDLGYEDKKEEVFWEQIEEGTYEEGYEEGYNDGYADAKRDEYRSYDEPYDYDDRPLW